MNTLISRAVLGATLFCSLALAQDPPPSPDTPAPAGQPGGKPPCGPPPEAYQACAGKSAGSRAEFTGPRGDAVQGVCASEGDGKMVLRPDHPPGGHRGPPPEALQACAGKSVGEKAQFLGPRGEIVSGTCEMVLRPDRPPQDGGGSQGNQGGFVHPEPVEGQREKQPSGN